MTIPDVAVPPSDPADERPDWGRDVMTRELTDFEAWGEPEIERRGRAWPR